MLQIWDVVTEHPYVFSATVGAIFLSYFVYSRLHHLKDVQTLQQSLTDFFFEQLSDESQKALLSLKTLFNIVSRVREFDRNGAGFKKPFLLCFSLLKKSQDVGVVKRWYNSASDVSDIAEAKLAFLRYFASYTTEIYKVTLLTAASAGLRSPNNVLCDVFGITPDDIIFNGFDDNTKQREQSVSDKKVMIPRYFVVLDHDKQSIVVCIRGTFSIEDTVVDLLANEEPFLDGFAHSGFMNAMLAIEEETRGSIRNSLLLYPEYQFILCGHSMGGGVAILLYMYICYGESTLSEVIGDRVFECIALGPAPVYLSDREIPSSVADKIWVLIHNGDFVSRFSVGTFAQLTYELRQIDDMSFTALTGLRVVYNTDNTELEEISRKLDSSRQNGFRFLTHPGRVYRMHRNHSDQLVLQRIGSGEVDNRIVMFDSMFKDHLPMAYASLFTSK